MGNIPLWAQLRTSDRDAAEGVVPALEQIVAAIRQCCKKVRIILRGDSGFCREEIRAWCERQPAVYYCLGLAKNDVLLRKAARALVDARARRCLTGAPSARAFTEFDYQTQKSWCRERRVIGKAEVMAAGDNPRFIVTNLPKDGFKADADRTRFTPARLYEELYCARGEMENVLKQQVLDMQADRMSTHYLTSNQLRLWLGTCAYLLMERVARVGIVWHRTGNGDGGQRALEVVESGGAGDGECAAGASAIEQCLSVGATFSVMSSAADGPGLVERLARARHHL